MSKVDQLRALREARFSHMHKTEAERSSKPQTLPPATNPFSPGSGVAPEIANGNAMARGEDTNTFRPAVPAGKSINEYTPKELEQLMIWVKLNNLTATEDELVLLGMQELGFTRRGKVIRQRLLAAIRAS